MLDKELQELLCQLGIEIDEPEEIPEKQPIQEEKKWLKNAGFLFLGILGGFFCSSWTDEEQKPVAQCLWKETVRLEYVPFQTRLISWSEHIEKRDPKIVEKMKEPHEHLLDEYSSRIRHSMLLREKELNDLSVQFATLLSTQSANRTNKSGQEALLLLKHYQAMDARHSLRIAETILDVKKAFKENTPLSQHYLFEKMIEDIGAEGYEAYKIEEILDPVPYIEDFQRAVEKIERAKNFNELFFAKEDTEEVLASLENESFMGQLFDSAFFNQRVREKIEKKVQSFLFNTKNSLVLTEYSDQNQTLFAIILDFLDLDKKQRQFYEEQFERLGRLLETKSQEIDDEQKSSPIVILNELERKLKVDNLEQLRNDNKSNRGI